MIRNFLLSSAAVLALATGARAADLPSRAPPPVYVPPAPIFTWTGVYIGGQVGYAWGQSNFNFSDELGDFAALGNNVDGVIGGAHVGYNLQLSQFVIGLEGDVDGTSLSRSRSQSLVLGSLPGEIDINVRHNIEGSIRGRVGYAWDRVLVYATGGAAFGGFNANASANFATFVPNGIGGGSVFDVAGQASSSATRVGWTVGGGLEYAVTNNWSIRAEYRYTDFGRSTTFTNLGVTFGGVVQPGIGAIVSRNFNENRVEVGFSYKFDAAAPAPVVAKY